jgi:hypothetical protein
VNNIYFQITNKSSNYTGNQVAKLTLINENKITGILYLTGQKAYSTDPYFLLADPSYFSNSYTLQNFFSQRTT